MKSHSNLIVSARWSRHPTYRRRSVYWGEVHNGPQLLYGIGPFRKKHEAEAAARLWANQHSLPTLDHAGPLLTRLPDIKTAPQKPCDIGLFSDETKQIDLEDLL